MQARGTCSIDLDAIAHNLGEVRRVVGPRVRVCAVVKADAYGHGAVPVSRHLLAHGAEMLAVASFDEARELRRGDIAAPVLVLGGIPAADAAAAADLGLVAVAWDPRAIGELGRAVPAGRRLRVHLKVNTGMTRIGCDPADLGAAADALLAGPFEVEGVLSHLACGEVPGDPSVAAQRAAFEEAIAVLAGRGLRPAVRHLANSGGLLADAATHFDMVRPGLALYGLLPSPLLADRAQLLPAMQFRAAIVALREVPAGARVGYGHTHEMRRPGRVAVLHVGYAQGYPRALSNRGSVLVRGRLAPVVGIVSMDHTTIDVTDVPGVAVGDEAVLWGHGDEPSLDVMSVGGLAGTIGYELLARVPGAIPRVHVSGIRARSAAHRA